MFASSLELGLAIINISDPSNPTMVSYVNKMVGEDLVLSSDEKYLFLADGFSGLSIINIEDRTAPVLISTIAVDGWVRRVKPLFDENYILASSAEKGFLTVINIEDKENPYILAKYSNFGEHANSLVVTPDNSTALLLGAKGLRVLSMKTAFSIHSEYKE